MLNISLTNQATTKYFDSFRKAMKKLPFTYKLAFSFLKKMNWQIWHERWRTLTETPFFKKKKKTQNLNVGHGLFVK
jgi:hypothetical protein